jgi:hypothetical protein
MLIAVCDCVRCAACGVRCVAFEFMQCAAVCGRTHSCVRQCGSVHGSLRGSVRLSGSARGSVRLSSGPAVCSSPAVSIFPNKFKTYSYKFV